MQRSNSTSRNPIDRLLERRQALVDGESTTDPAASVTILRAALEVPRALLLVNDAATRVRCRDLLETGGMCVETEERLEAACERASAEAYPIIVVDQIESARALRALPAKSRSHIIFIASSGSTDDCLEALRADASEAFPAHIEAEFIQARFALARQIAQLEASLTRLRSHNQSLATIDELTRAASRRFFDRQYPREARLAARRQLALSVIICDIDHFKSINDAQGHAAGDAVLREFGTRLFGALRGRQDWLARVGGEEFAIVLSQTAPPEAGNIARRIREALCEVPFQIRGKTLNVTASFGVAGVSCAPSNDDGFGDRLLRAADRALYKSKDTGRNCVTVATFKG